MTRLKCWTWGCKIWSRTICRCPKVYRITEPTAPKCCNRHVHNTSDGEQRAYEDDSHLEKTVEMPESSTSNTQMPALSANRGPIGGPIFGGRWRAPPAANEKPLEVANVPYPSMEGPPPHLRSDGPTPTHTR